MKVQIKCGTDMRRTAVKNAPTINGIDYMEVFLFRQENASFRPLLIVYCFKSSGLSDLHEDNIIIEGGVRRKNIKAEWIRKADTIINDLVNATVNDVTKDLSTEEKNTIKGTGSDSVRAVIIRPSGTGDLSKYMLRFVRGIGDSDDDGGGGGWLEEKEKEKELPPPKNFDIILSKLDFSFMIGCPADFDCLAEDTCYLYPKGESPAIDYMAKDFASFRRLILDRLSAVMPNWRERNPADLGIMLVELLSYIGDHLSYYQDAVATEAYLGTERNRISVRRNVRLLDYFMHDGCNARCWVCINVEKGIKEFEIKKGTKLLTKGTDSDPSHIIIPSENFEETLNNIGTEVFETMYDVTLYDTHNQMLFYTWGGSQCCLPRGATSATIRNDGNNKLDLLLFSWTNIIKDPPNENDLDLLKNFLKKNFGLEWLEESTNLQFLHISDSLLKLSDDTNILYMILNNSSSVLTAAKDEAGKYKVCDFNVKEENGELNVYIVALKAGDVLIFEEISSPTTHKPADKDPSHRHAVRLSKVTPNFDELFGVPVIDIFWEPEDALPFPLCLEVVDENGSSSDTSNDDEKERITISVASGNTVLADNGYKIVKAINSPSFENRALFYTDDYYDGNSDDDDDNSNDNVATDIPYDNSSLVNATEFLGYAPPTSSAIGKTRFRPRLSRKPLTFKGPFDRSLPASAALVYDVHDAHPDIILSGEGKTWSPSYDLLESGEFDHNFVVEVENDGSAFIRFVELGKVEETKEGIVVDDIINNNNKKTSKPSPFYATYRVGNGTRGNVGAESITRIVLDEVEQKNSPISKIRNPMPAKGGTDPEDIELVRQYAPEAFRRQERAVTADDYMEVLKRHPEVQKGFATIRWTGSWYTVFVSVDRFDGRVVDGKFKEDIRNFLNRYRLAGYDLEIREPVYVPLLISINICIETNYFPSDIRQRLLEVFSNHDTEILNGERGFFHPDNWSFGKAVLLSQIYETAIGIEGITSCTVEKFQRWGKMSNGEIEKGIIEMTYYEIARLDNDPNFPENGKIEFMIGGFEPPLKKITLTKL